jgi:hypothetical protein
MPARYECESCQNGKKESQLAPRSLEDRRYMHCGWLKEREWLDAPPRDPRGRLRPPRVIGAGLDEPGVDWGADVCPGWAVRQPLIIECCQAHKAFDKGAMDAFFPDVAHCVAEGVMELSRTFDEYSRQKLTAASKRNERNG